MSVSPTPEPLRTGLAGCRLRRWQAGDKADLVRHGNDRSVWRNLTDMFPHPYTDADADSWLRIAADPAAGVHLAIEYGGAAVGGIGAIPGRGVASRTAQFGYWLGQSHWGRGIATAAVRAMTAHLFATTGFARLEAPVFAWNPASMRVLEKAGFAREGVLRHSVFKDGQLIDSVVYALIRAA